MTYQVPVEYLISGVPTHQVGKVRLHKGGGVTLSGGLRERDEGPLSLRSKGFEKNRQRETKKGRSGPKSTCICRENGVRKSAGISLLN